MVDQKTDYDRRVSELQDALVGKLYSSVRFLLVLVVVFVFEEMFFSRKFLPVWFEIVLNFLINLGKNNFLVNSKGSQVLVTETNFLGLTVFLFFTYLLQRVSSQENVSSQKQQAEQTSQSAEEQISQLQAHRMVSL